MGACINIDEAKGPDLAVREEISGTGARRYLSPPSLGPAGQLDRGLGAEGDRSSEGKDPVLAP
jgi:hypothetical protein